MHNLKKYILIFEMASYNAFAITQNGFKGLLKLGFEKNVVKLKDIDENSEIGKMSIMACQSIPGIVMLSFATELAIKQILFQNTNGIDKTHELRLLFKHLTKEQKIRIKDFVKKKLNINDKDFDLQLKNNSRLFTNWRYGYEDNNTMEAGGIFIQALFKSLKKEIHW